jgi:hypothetical protein
MLEDDELFCAVLLTMSSARIEQTSTAYSFVSITAQSSLIHFPIIDGGDISS